jgi:hypothetical protein
MRRPMSVMIQEHEGDNKFIHYSVKSIFQMKKESLNFLNYWNLKQVVYISGELDLAMDLTEFVT